VLSVVVLIDDFAFAARMKEAPATMITTTTSLCFFRLAKQLSSSSSSSWQCKKRISFGTIMNDIVAWTIVVAALVALLFLCELKMMFLKYMGFHPDIFSAASTAFRFQFILTISLLQFYPNKWFSL